MALSVWAVDRKLSSQIECTQYSNIQQ